MASRDARLLAEVRALAPEHDVTDALLATRAVGWVRVVGGLLGLLMLGLAWLAGSWIGAVLGIIALLGLPTLATYGRPPLALARAGDEVLVFDTTRVLQRPDHLVDILPAESLTIDFPGALSDKWEIGGRKIGIYRGERSRLERWSDQPAPVS